MKRRVLDLPFDSRFLVSFPCCGFGGGCISVNPSLGKGPASAASAHQEKFRLLIFKPIANCCNMNTFACGFSVEIRTPALRL